MVMISHMYNIMHRILNVNNQYINYLKKYIFYVNYYPFFLKHTINKYKTKLFVHLIISALPLREIARDESPKEIIKPFHE